jgi:hypothetical protein
MNARARIVAASGLIFMPSSSSVALATAALVGTDLVRPWAVCTLEAGGAVAGAARAHARRRDSGEGLGARVSGPSSSIEK